MNESELNELRGKHLRRKLEAKDEAALRGHFAESPGSEAAWDEDVALNQLLRDLPDAPVSSNFTSRLMRQIEAENQRPARTGLAGVWETLLAGWKAKAALAAAGAAALALGFVQYNTNVREQMARNAGEVSAYAAFSNIEVLQDFEAIQSLVHTPKADMELLAALK